MIKVFILSLCLTMVSACSKKAEVVELKYTPEEFNLIMDSSGAGGDKEITNAINFADYSTGVNKSNSKPLVYQRLSFAVLEFETETQAKNEALRLNQYYSRNWLFDKVEGEPILEDLILVKYHAKNPKRNTQRTPVNIPPEHAAPPAGSGGGEHH